MNGWAGNKCSVFVNYMNFNVLQLILHSLFIGIF